MSKSTYFDGPHEFATVANIEGLGCSYNILRDMTGGDALCTIVCFSGPVRKVLVENVTWLAAMQYVANEVERDINENCELANEHELAVIACK